MGKFKGFDDDDLEYENSYEDERVDHRRERQNRRNEKDQASFFNPKVDTGRGNKRSR